jgi:hypothetical protein
MAVEMVGGEVEHGGHPRPEGLRRLQLEGGRLRHHDAGGGEIQRPLGQRGADIAAHQHRAELAAQDLAG